MEQPASPLVGEVGGIERHPPGVGVRADVLPLPLARQGTRGKDRSSIRLKCSRRSFSAEGPASGTSLGSAAPFKNQNSFGTIRCWPGKRPGCGAKHRKGARNPLLPERIILLTQTPGRCPFGRRIPRGVFPQFPSFPVVTSGIERESLGLEYEQFIEAGSLDSVGFGVGLGSAGTLRGEARARTRRRFLCSGRETA